MERTPAVHGHVHPAFTRVREVFEENFTERGEVGAAFSVVHRGERVVDLWGGLADREEARPWEADTLCVMFSATKGLAALALLMLQDRGLLDPAAPVAEYWPGFARAGKERITVGQLLDHRAGLCAIDAPLSLEDLESRPDVVLEALEAQEPLWEPGTDQGYHGVSFGPYASELFRRVAGTSLGRFLAEEVAGPLDAEVHLGLPEDLDPRVATLYPAGKRDLLLRILPRLAWGRTTEGRIYRGFLQKETPTARAFANPADLGARGIQNFNTPRVRRMELAWANAIGSARGLATVYGALARGGAPLLERGALRPVYERRSWTERDRVVHKPLGFSLGFQKEQRVLFSPNDRSFGHPGAGGALGWCDPDHQVGWGYLMNRMDFRLRSPRAIALSHAVYACL